ncbi:MAG: 3D domain-containing protein [Clostridiales bacterium]|nr:3D domain-containing protein [Clostridiales bacterium]
MAKPKGVWLQTTELGEIKEAAVVRSNPVNKPDHCYDKRRKSPALFYSLGACCVVLLALTITHVFSASAFAPEQESNNINVNMEWIYSYESFAQWHTVRVLADGQEYLTSCVDQTVAQVLHQMGLELSVLDEVSLPLDMFIDKECVIEINRVYSRALTETEIIAPAQVRAEDATLAPGENRVVREGKSGLRENTFRVYYNDGVETGRELISSQVIEEPGITTVAYGVIELASRSGGNNVGVSISDSGAALTVDGKSYNYTHKLSMESTAYTWTGNRTATGTWPAGGTVAVDPRVIPLGSKLYVEGYGFAIAADTGGAINGNIIDVYLSTHDACIRWGRKHGVAVYILE